MELTCIKPNSIEPYSNQEIRVLNALRKGPCTIKHLLRYVYDGQAPPKNAGPSVNAVLGELRRKIEINQECFAIRRTERKIGEYTEHWLEPTDL